VDAKAYLVGRQRGIYILLFDVKFILCTVTVTVIVIISPGLNTGNL
jgi:hypothetical protein